jgi:SAM-dependent methyltransferase
VIPPAQEASDQRLRESPYSSTETYGKKKIIELLDVVVRALPAGARALDVGCRAGYGLHHLRERGLEVAGVEADPTLRARAEEGHPGVEIRDGHIEALPFPDASFQLIVAIDGLVGVDEPARAAAEVARVLEPGGMAFVTAAPRRRRGAAQLAAPFAAAGFAEVQVHGVFVGPRRPLDRVPGPVLARVLRLYEPVDDWLSGVPALRQLANHQVVIGSRR